MRLAIICLLFAYSINSCKQKQTQTQTSCVDNKQKIFEVGDFLKNEMIEQYYENHFNDVNQKDTTFLLAKNSVYSLIYSIIDNESTVQVLKNDILFLKIKNSKLIWYFYNENKFKPNNRLMSKNNIAMYIADYDSDSKRDLIIRDRVHNGTLNVVMDRVFKIDTIINEATYKYGVSYKINRQDEIVLFQFYCGKHFVYSKLIKEKSKWNFEGQLTYELKNNNLQINEKGDSLIYYYPPIMEN